MRYLHFVLACTLLQQGQPFAPPLCVRKQSPVLRASSADDNTDEIDADEAARIAEMRKRMEGMFSGAEAEAAPATEDAPGPPPDRDPKPPRLGRGTPPRWTPPKRRAVTKAQDAEPFTRREVRGGRDVVQERRRNDDNIPGLVNFASDPRTFAAGGAVVALSFVLYVARSSRGESTTARRATPATPRRWAAGSTSSRRNQSTTEQARGFKTFLQRPAKNGSGCPGSGRGPSRTGAAPCRP